MPSALRGVHMCVARTCNVRVSVYWEESCLLINNRIKKCTPWPSHVHFDRTHFAWIRFVRAKYFAKTKCIASDDNDKNAHSREIMKKAEEKEQKQRTETRSPQLAVVRQQMPSSKWHSWERHYASHEYTTIEATGKGTRKQSKKNNNKRELKTKQYIQTHPHTHREWKKERNIKALKYNNFNAEIVFFIWLSVPCHHTC